MAVFLVSNIQGVTMKNGKLCFLVAAIPIIASCVQNGNQRAIKHFEINENLSAEYVEIDEIIEINNIVKLDDYIILQNVSEGVDDFFFVYSYPEFEFLYSFAGRGRGPNEYLMPAVIKNSEGNVIGFKDHATDKIAFYEITDSLAVLKDAYRYKAKDKERFFWELNNIGDSLFLVKHQGYKNGATELWDMKGMTLLDSISNTFANLPKKLKRDYYTIFDDYQLVSNGNQFSLGYFLIDRLEFGAIVGNKILKDTSIGAERPPRFHLYGDDSDEEFSVDRNIVCYENLYAGENHVYALYSGKRLDETEKHHSSTIEIYSWEGKPEMQLNLEVPVAYFVTDEEERVIYAVNPSLYENKIIRYHF